MSHVICQASTEGCKVATSDKIDRKNFFAYVDTMKACGATFDRTGKFYTLTQEAWGKAKPVIESLGLTVGEGTMEKPIALPVGEDKVVSLNKFEKAAFATLEGKFNHLLQVIKGGSMSGSDKKNLKKIFELLA